MVFASFQASAAVLVRSSLLYVVTWLVFRIVFRRFGTPNRSHLRGPNRTLKAEGLLLFIEGSMTNSSTFNSMGMTVRSDFV
jgi:hypothetical protein